MDVPELVSDSSSAYQSSPEVVAYDTTHEMENVGYEIVELDYACVCCDPHNKTGYNCPQTFSIAKKKTKKQVESWHSNLIRGDKFRSLGITNHEECIGCHLFLPAHIPGVVNQCSCCAAYSCDNITPGGCKRNFSIAPLSDPKLPPNSLNWILSNHNAASLLNRYGTVDDLIKAVIDALPRKEDKRVLSNGLTKSLDDHVCSNCVWKDVVVDGLHLLWKHTNTVN